MATIRRNGHSVIRFHTHTPHRDISARTRCTTTETPQILHARHSSPMHIFEIQAWDLEQGGVASAGGAAEGRALGYLEDAARGYECEVAPENVFNIWDSGVTKVVGRAGRAGRGEGIEYQKSRKNWHPIPPPPPLGG